MNYSHSKLKKKVGKEELHVQLLVSVILQDCGRVHARPLTPSDTSSFLRGCLWTLLEGLSRPCDEDLTRVGGGRGSISRSNGPRQKVQSERIQGEVDFNAAVGHFFTYAHDFLRSEYYLKWTTKTR